MRWVPLSSSAIGCGNGQVWLAFKTSGRSKHKLTLYTEEGVKQWANHQPSVSLKKLTIKTLFLETFIFDQLPAKCPSTKKLLIIILTIFLPVCPDFVAHISHCCSFLLLERKTMKGDKMQWADSRWGQRHWEEIEEERIQRNSRKVEMFPLCCPLSANISVKNKQQT